ncbi:MAG TPA: DUF1697 domain-containing protein [Jatrophihabitans sp.]|jgi:uncharacterized protein (DUF1697 family)|uniref:DUF1697 domain-containing protein n=1 Tax=Jatrophihabitans sp. TaxID=1932789 RepID=UPI002F256E52
MTRWVALLAGINIGGKTTVPMAQLRTVFADLGYRDVQTYIQSGNVVFAEDTGDEGKVIAAIRPALSATFGWDIEVLLRTAPELAAVVAGNPFLERQDDPTKLLVTFLSAEPAADRAARLQQPPAGETGEVALAGREVYVHAPDGYGRSKLNNAYLARVLGVAATTRNWKSVTKLHELATG